MPAIPLEVEPDFLAGNGFGQNFLAIGCGVDLSGLLARPSPLIAFDQSKSFGFVVLWGVAFLISFRPRRHGQNARMPGFLARCGI